MESIVAVVVDDVLIVSVLGISDIEASSFGRSNVSSRSFEPSHELGCGNLSGVDTGHVDVLEVAEATSDIESISSVSEASQGLGS